MQRSHGLVARGQIGLGIVLQEKLDGRQVFTADGPTERRAGF
jgi:hypothetical protein